MKRCFFLLLFLLTGAAAFAQPEARGAITVVSRQPVMMAIDNRLYEASGTELTIGNIPRGAHNLKIYQARTRRGRTVQGYLLFETIVRVKPERATIAFLEPRRGRLRISSRPLGAMDEMKSGTTPSDAPSIEDDIYSKAPGNEESTLPQNTGTEALSYQLTGEQLNELRTQVEPLLSDTKKKEKLIAVLGMKTYTVAQLQEITAWLNFESERLEFLKWAYTNTEDKDAYQELETLFRYESSKSELRDYIARQ